MFSALVNVFKIEELRSKILFTLGMLAVYRVGYAIPLPGVNADELRRSVEIAASQGNALGRAAQYVAVFSGGSFSQSTIFGLGIMPYISAAIIFQLLGSVSTTLKNLQNEGPTGRQKIQEWTRYATVGLCLMQSIGWLTFITSQGMVYPSVANQPLWWIMAVSALTAGTVFLMWLGEQIDKYGIGNGVSMIITAGILAGMPSAVTSVLTGFDPTDPTALGWPELFLLLGGFVLVVAGSVLMTVAQRRIPIQQAKHTRGRKVFGGQRSFLPLRVNHGGVMPIIFASSLLIFPSTIVSGIETQLLASQQFENTWLTSAVVWLSRALAPGEYLYILIFIAMTYFFSYFWITVQFNPEEISKQLRDNGSFIPGLRPGPRTAEYLETVMERLTYVGAAFLAVIAVLPLVTQNALGIDYSVTQFLGGTGLLIVVSVVLDFVQRVEANLLMRNYAGFLGGGEDGKGGPKMRSARGG
ncbi:MAG: preprotein translocase subunit SecY [Planctomycetota bacterium]